MASWVSIAKPSLIGWNNVSPMGKEAYDQSTIEYDDSSVWYDGVNPSQWTDIPKPVGHLIHGPGYATGLIMPPTYSQSVYGEIWTMVPKPD